MPSIKRIFLFMQANFMIYFIIVIINFYLQSPAVLVINSSATDNTVDPNHITSVANKEDLTVKKYQEYIPSIVENYLRDNLDYLGYNTITSNPSGCKIWQDQTATTPAIHSLLASYSADLKNYTGIVKKFKQIPDLLKIIQKTNSHDICVTARPHPHGIKALFPSNQLSLSDSGYVEPLTTPMRHHDICTEGSRLMTLEYLVHDFEAMCRKLKPTSKRILIDMGASLSFHGEETKSPQPIVELLNLYKKFGFKFDHIYGFEVTFTDPKEVYENLLPEEYLPNYHWINVGVNSAKGHKLNPLHSILKSFDEDDFIVVKLDIDTGSIEVPLATQLLEDEDGIYHKLIDHFYFEHHVHIKELAPFWADTMQGSIKNTFDLFYGLRKMGIPAHFWP